MALAAEVVGGILAAVLLVLTMVALWVGYGALFGGRVGKCPRCGRFAVTVGRQFHPGGCPISLQQHIESLGSAWSHEVHFRHH